MKVNRRRIGGREPFGFWKSDGNIILIQKSNHTIGCKKTFIFYGDQTTDWMMEIYTIVKGTIELDDWILCKVYRNEKENYDSDCYSDLETDYYDSECYSDLETDSDSN
ncbi:NAC domain-containing protein 19-like [Ziziphus jujuba]|uniref:NAC domain-containing protein 19-like n=1 Tax=Ziziphus jujuba TaxID=326968 RepID=A0ABM3IPT2_ZIZJJ|nr:NAC domain-containing protein 19-like [Ziziphus jujuba]